MTTQTLASRPGARPGRLWAFLATLRAKPMLALSLAVIVLVLGLSLIHI